MERNTRVFCQFEAALRPPAEPTAEPTALAGLIMCSPAAPRAARAVQAVQAAQRAPHHCEKAPPVLCRAASHVLCKHGEPARLPALPARLRPAPSQPPGGCHPVVPSAEITRLTADNHRLMRTILLMTGQ